jgi:hypothetical protein
MKGDCKGLSPLCGYQVEGKGLFTFKKQFELEAELIVILHNLCAVLHQ